MATFDAKKYKFAKIVDHDLSAVVPVIEKTIRLLKPYRIYTSVARLLEDMEDRCGVLKLQLEKHKRIVKEKGKVDG